MAHRLSSAMSNGGWVVFFMGKVLPILFHDFMISCVCKGGLGGGGLEL